MDTRKKDFIHFKPMEKVNAVIIQQPVTITEYYKSGPNKGQVKGVREIQYVPNLNTIFVDEQIKLNPKAKQEPIYLKRKPISVRVEQANKIEFLRAHPENVANGGKLFKEYDVQAEDTLQLEQFEKLDKAKARLMEADDTTIRAVTAWFLKPAFIYLAISKVKLAIREKLEQNPKLDNGKHFIDAFNDFLDSKNNKEKLLTTTCLEKSIIKIVDGKKIVWSSSNEVIFIGSQEKDVLDEFSNWLLTSEDGRQTTSVLADKIKIN